MKKIAEFKHGERIVKVYRDSEYDEFICKLTERGQRRQGADYYTDCKRDAIGTAQVMVKE